MRSHQYSLLPQMQVMLRRPRLPPVRLSQAIITSAFLNIHVQHLQYQTQQIARESPNAIIHLSSHAKPAGVTRKNKLDGSFQTHSPNNTYLGTHRERASYSTCAGPAASLESFYWRTSPQTLRVAATRVRLPPSRSTRPRDHCHAD